MAHALPQALDQLVFRGLVARAEEDRASGFLLDLDRARRRGELDAQHAARLCELLGVGPSDAAAVAARRELRA